MASALCQSCAFWHSEIGSACEEERCGPACDILTQWTADKADQEIQRSTKTKLKLKNTQIIVDLITVSVQATLSCMSG